MEGVVKFLIVYSHPNPESFNHAILLALKQKLEELKQEVRVRDLYAINYDPVLKASDLASFSQKKFAPDIKDEQDHIRWADFLVFICPIWWGGLTANLRGYFDRVFSLNFAYQETQEGIKGLLSGKTALFISTLGAPFKVYQDIGMIKSMNQTIDEVISGFCGMKTLEHKYFGSVGTCSYEERLKMLEEIKDLAEEIVLAGVKDAGSSRA